MLKSRKRSDKWRVTSNWRLLASFVSLFMVAHAHAQTLNVPSRPANAPDGTQFTNIITGLSVTEREKWVYAQVINGNLPDWMRTLQPINTSFSGHTATYHVLPDYLAIGSDTNYFLEPTTPILAQRLADRLGCTLPTRKMVDQIWTNAAVKLTPVTFDPMFYDILSLEVFGGENAGVRAQRVTNAPPLGALVGGDKKDVIISTKIYTNFYNASITHVVVIYGWHYPGGSHIQNIFNGHEETYADYSHGTRLVQMNLTMDGSPNTVTNILTNPSLAKLLSDEGTAEGTSVNSEIAMPRYTVAALAPTVMTHPRSQSVYVGANIILSTLAIGDLPLTFRWQFNGANIAGATNSNYSLTNIAIGNAGYYSVVATNNSGSVTSRVAVLRVRTNSFPVMFADDFETNSSVNWNLFFGTTNGITDYDVDWAFDYGVIPYTFNGVTALIPPAPNSRDGSTRALRLAVNQNDTNAVIAAVSLYPKNRFFSGNFALKFDMWLHYPGGAGGSGSGVAGSTQHATFGLNHLGTNVNWAAPSATSSDGIWFGATGEGGDSKDYRAYAGNLAGTQIDLVAAGTSGLTASNNNATIFQNLFPTSRFETAGAPGKNWVEVEVRYTNNTVMWLMDGTLIGQRNNSSVFTNGNIMIGLMDVFNSIAAPARNSFVLFDNLRVENLTPMPIRFQSATRLLNGQVSLLLTNVPGDNYYLDASSNLNSWQSLAGILATNSTFTFIDSNAPAFPTRYYRARR